MRALLLVALLVAGALAATPGKSRKYGTLDAANINDYIDKELPNIAQFLYENGMDPIALPDNVQTFSEEGPLGITWHGELALFDGRLGGLSQVVRAGDAYLDFSEHHYKVNLTLGFQFVELSYDFVCKLMDIGPTGTLYGDVFDLAVFVELALDMSNITSPVISLNNLYFSNRGTLDIDLEGVGMDLLDNIIADLVSRFFQDDILDAVENKVRDLVQKALDGLNSKIVLPQVTRMLLSQRGRH